MAIARFLERGTCLCESHNVALALLPQCVSTSPGWAHVVVMDRRVTLQSMEFLLWTRPVWGVHCSLRAAIFGLGRDRAQFVGGSVSS